MTVPVYAWFSALLRKPLTRDGGSRYKGVNSLKSSEDLWGPVRWHSRLDPFPYSEPLTNLASYFGARGISDKLTKPPLASHRLEDDLGYSPVNVVRRVREQESAEDQEQKSVTRVALIGCRRRCQCAEESPIREPCDPDAVVPSLMKLLVDFLGGYAEEIGELTLNGCEWVGHEDALGRGRGPLDERRVLFDCGH
ncbi:hypothetical protein CRG98_020555 [Punica granatum]|uniref:Uncharacterized protein n=1 Tax=Punica granatum TaxID=22663 RepID=A0A2I0JRV2_PUNGR|nr:hypothetical protein CRG98_020555 [Punica granatum]